MLDEFDAQILRLLCRNGRMSLQEMSDKIGLSPSPISRRIKNLEDRGIITGYTARIDEVLLGYEVSVFVSVQLDKQVDDALAAFEARIAGFPEVVDCWLMTGDRDYLMRVSVANMREFERFLVERLTKTPGVSSIQSSIPLRNVKANGARSP